MPITVAKLVHNCRQILLEDSGPEGRIQVAALLSEILSDQANVDALITADTSERDVLYEDPDLGFCIIAHVFKEAKVTKPHHHGPAWAIYAQASGETKMTDYEWATPDTKKVPGKVRATKTYDLKPGDAHVYNEGELHAPTRVGPTSMIRIEGIDLTTVHRRLYEAV